MLIPKNNENAHYSTWQFQGYSYTQTLAEANRFVWRSGDSSQKWLLSDSIRQKTACGLGRGLRGDGPAWRRCPARRRPLPVFVGQGKLGMAISRFEVYLINLDPTVGSEIQKSRPCLVVSPEDMNYRLKTVIVAPMTTKGQPYPTRVACRFQGRNGQVI